MKTRRLQKLIWWLLPLFALRGLVPVGFMVNVADGELSMAVCPMHQNLDASQSRVDRTLFDARLGQSDSSQHQNDSQSECPFAAALSSATFIGLTTPALAFASESRVSLNEASISHVPFGPSRAQQSRAPPRYS
jgi:hypothetical protein